MSMKDVQRIKTLERFRLETEEILDQILTRLALLEDKIEKNKSNGKNDRARTTRASSG